LFSAVFGNVRPIFSISLKPWANVRRCFLGMLDYLDSWGLQALRHNDRALLYGGPTPGST
jgi:hypothetical protein